MAKFFLNRIHSDHAERNSIGGTSHLPQDQALPDCRLCNSPMVLFFQVDLAAEYELPFIADSHLSVFMCPVHNEIPSFEHYTELPPDYWDKAEGHWFALLTKPGNEANSASPPFLQPAKLIPANEPEDTDAFFAIGGSADWVQSPEQFICSCKADMTFICQLSEYYQFPKQQDAPEQPDSPSSSDYVLFLGNEVYIFGCTNQCNPRAIWVTVQN